MARALSTLLKEEAVSTEQSRLFKLVTIELDNTYVIGNGLPSSSQLTLSSTTDILVGQTIEIEGVTGTFKVLDIVGEVATLNVPLPSLLVDAKVFFTRIFNVVDSNYDVEYDGVKYLRFPIQVSETTISTDGSIDKASLSVANVTREIMYYVEHYDGLVNRKVTIKSVFARFMDKLYYPQADGTVEEEVNTEKDTSSYTKEEFLIDTYSATEKVVRFSLDPVIDLEIQIPRRRYLDSNSCSFRYRDADTCKYAGVLPKCNKNLADCKLHNNSLNFGGFAGLDSSNQRRVWL